MKITIEQKTAIIGAMNQLLVAVQRLNKVYEDQAFNDIQPDSMQKMLPMSIDEWESELYGCIDDWNKLPS
jgi:hypothetical protein